MSTIPERDGVQSTYSDTTHNAITQIHTSLPPSLETLLLTDIQNAFPAMSEEECELSLVLLKSRAETIGISLADYITQYHPNGIAERDETLPSEYKGYIQFLSTDAQALIKAGRNADFSTFVHENAHVFRRQLTGELQEQAEQAFHVEGSAWTEAQEEAFALGFEEYVRLRLSESDTHRELFEKGSIFLQRIYNGLDRIIELNPEIIQVYDKLFIDGRFQFRQDEFETAIHDIAAEKTESLRFSSSHVYLGMTPSMYQELGFERLPVMMTAKHIKTAMMETGINQNINYHGLGAELIKQIPEAIKKPLLIMQSSTIPEDLIAVLELQDKNGKQIIIPFAANKKGNFNDIEIDITLAKTIYGKDNFKSFLKKAIEENRILYIDKKSRDIIPPEIHFLRNDNSQLLYDNIQRYKEVVKEKNKKSGILYQENKKSQAYKNLKEIANASFDFAEFRKKIVQNHLIDLSNPELHRFGRAISYVAEEEYVDAQEIAEGKYNYLETIKHDNQAVYYALSAPSSTVTIYRAIPITDNSQFPEEIRVGDYVTLNKDYAKDHGEYVLKGQQQVPYKILSKEVPKTDVVWGECDWTEWAYSPRDLRKQIPSLEALYSALKNDEYISPNILYQTATPDPVLSQAHAELETVRARYVNTDAWMKAPNGETTKLTERQWLQVRTPSFKAWFGDWENDPANASKVIAENGEPLVVYHNTDTAIHVFNGDKTYDGNFWFTSMQGNAETGASASGIEIAAFLNIKHPASWEQEDRLSDTQMIQNGFDGKNLDGDYVAFNPTQIKSATHNIGTFDLHNPNILYQAATPGTVVSQAHAELETVRARYVNTDAWLKAPNGETTKLSERQWLQVRTPSFKAWFGDWEGDPENASKVIDENGEPMVVYRGTPKDLGNSFKYNQNIYGGNDGFWFTVSESVAKDYSFDDINGTYGDVKAVFLNSKKTLDASELGSRCSSKDFYNFFDKKFGYSEKSGSNKIFEVQKLHKENQGYINNNLSRNKYDGFAFIDVTTHSKVFITFKPNQIKSATHNIGTFDLHNPNILYQAATPGTVVSQAHAELENVRARYVNTEAWMKAPNGEATKLTEQQWIEVRTPSFKAWFGDWETDPQKASKVIDENGEPLIVYHGTDARATHNIFSRSMTFFAEDVNNARVRGCDKSMDKVRAGEPFAMYADEHEYITARVYNTYLSLSNPYIVDANDAFWNEIDAPKEMGGHGLKTTDQIGRWAKRNGYDGAIIKNIVEDGYYNTTVYISFSSSQIKSATHNIGTFEKNNPNILYQKQAYYDGKHLAVDFINDPLHTTTGNKRIDGNESVALKSEAHMNLYRSTSMGDVENKAGGITKNADGKAVIKEKYINNFYNDSARLIQGMLVKDTLPFLPAKDGTCNTDKLVYGLSGKEVQGVNLLLAKAYLAEKGLSDTAIVSVGATYNKEKGDLKIRDEERKNGFTLSFYDSKNKQVNTMRFYGKSQLEQNQDAAKLKTPKGEKLRNTTIRCESSDPKTYLKDYLKSIELGASFAANTQVVEQFKRNLADEIIKSPAGFLKVAGLAERSLAAEKKQERAPNFDGYDLYSLIEDGCRYMLDEREFDLYKNKMIEAIKGDTLMSYKFVQSNANSILEEMGYKLGVDGGDVRISFDRTKLASLAAEKKQERAPQRDAGYDR